MANDFRSYNVIYVIYDRKNESNCSLLITHYSLFITHYSEYKHPIRANMDISATMDTSATMDIWATKLLQLSKTTYINKKTLKRLQK